MSRVGQGLRAVLSWERVIAAESGRLRITWLGLAAIALLVIFSGYIPSDGTDLGRVKVTLRLVEGIVTFAAMTLVIVLGAYFIPYEEMQNRRILITGVLPAQRWAILAGTALGVFRVSAIFLAVGMGFLAFKLYVTERPAMLRHVAGRESHPAQYIIYRGEKYEKGTVTLPPGKELEVHFVRSRPEVGAALRVTPYSTGGRYMEITVRILGEEPKVEDGEVAIMGQPTERLAAPGGSKEIALYFSNASAGRISIPLSEASIVEETVPLWSNMLRAMMLRWTALLYLSLVTVGVSAFLGMIPTLIVSSGVVLGGYLAPFVNALMRLPRYEEGAQVSASWEALRWVGKLFGDLAHAGPGESLPLGEIITYGHIASALWLLVNGAVVFAVGWYMLKRREVAA